MKKPTSGTVDNPNRIELMAQIRIAAECVLEQARQVPEAKEATKLFIPAIVWSSIIIAGKHDTAKYMMDLNDEWHEKFAKATIYRCWWIWLKRDEPNT